MIYIFVLIGIVHVCSAAQIQDPFTIFVDFSTSGHTLESLNAATGQAATSIETYPLNYADPQNYILHVGSTWSIQYTGTARMPTNTCQRRNMK